MEDAEGIEFLVEKLFFKWSIVEEFLWEWVLLDSCCWKGRDSIIQLYRRVCTIIIQLLYNY